MDDWHGRLAWMTGMDDWQVFIERLEYNDQLVTYGRTLLDVKSLSRLKSVYLFPQSQIGE